MPSDVEIVNAALDKLDGKTITSLSENTPSGKRANRGYAILRDRLLQEHDWGFAKKQAALAADSATPNHEWDYQYSMPSDCLRVLQVGDGERTYFNYEWAVHGSKIVTDVASTINITYIRQVTETGEFDPLFVEAFSAMMASEWAYPVTKNAGVQANMEQLYRVKLAQAKAASSRERSVKILDESTYIEGRHSGFQGFYRWWVQ